MWIVYILCGLSLCSGLVSFVYFRSKVSTLEIINKGNEDEIHRLVSEKYLKKDIDEEWLDKLAYEKFNEYIKTATHSVGGYIDGFKDGYKSKE